MPRKIVVNGPCYKSELLTYEKETMKKIEGFRRARSSWLASAEDSEKAFTKVKEGTIEPNVYEGRCKCLRKLKLKTTLLRYHYKDLRPVKYWTFRKKLPDYELYDENLVQETIKKETDTDLIQETCSGIHIWKKAEVDECEREAAKIKGRRARKLKRKICREKKVSGPCKKALSRLKASKIKEGLIESCRCEDGREVTVVIKGICLCDRSSLHKANLTKVCDEFNKTKRAEEVSYTAPAAKLAEVPGVAGGPGATSAAGATGAAGATSPAGPTGAAGASGATGAAGASGATGAAGASGATGAAGASGATGAAGASGAAADANKQAMETDTPKGENEENLEVKPSVLHATDSLEILKKRMSSVHLKDGMRQDEEQDEEATMKPETKRKLSFKDEKNLKGDGGRNVSTPSEVTLYKKLSSDFFMVRESVANEKTVTRSASSFEGLDVPVKEKTKEKIKKPRQVDQAESLNNLLESQKGKMAEKARVAPKTKVADEKLNSETKLLPSASANSLEIHKKHLEKKENPSKTGHKHSNEDPTNKNPTKTTERKTKVRLNDKPTIIPNIRYPAEKVIPPHPETKHRGALMETHEVVTSQKAWNKNVSSDMSPSKSTAKPDSRQPSTMKQDASMSLSESIAEVDSQKSSKMKKDASIVTLYKNKSEEKSEMGLTKEEKQRMKEVQEEKRLVKKKKLSAGSLSRNDVKSIK